MKQTCCGSLLLFFCIASMAQPRKPASSKPVLSGENYLVVSGYPYKDVKCIFSQINEGGWFTTDKTAFLNIELEGNSGGSHFVMWLTIDGTPDKHSYTVSRFTDIMGDGETFAMNFERKANGDVTRYQAEEEHPLHVEISTIDNNHLQFTVHGNIGQGEGSKLEGKFSLTQESPSLVKVLKDKYPGCDNTIYDKMSGAQNRTATECEIKFDEHIKTTIHDAFKMAISGLEHDHWKLNAETAMTPINQVTRHSENYPSQLGDYDLAMELENTSAEYAAYYKKYNDAMTSMSNNTSTDPAVLKANIDKLQKVGREYRSNANASIIIRINYENSDIFSYKSDHKVLSVSGVAYAVQCSEVSARTGGGAENALEATFLFIGKWKPATIVKNDDGSENIRLAGGLNKAAPVLGVQNILIRMECGAAVAQKILDKLDVHQIAALVN